MERARDQLGDRSGVVGGGDELRHLAEHARVVELLERLSAEVGARHLADEQDDRRRVLIGGVDPDRRVGGARRAGDEADPRPAGQLAVRVGHVRGACLVARRVETDVRLADRVQHGDVALARDAVRGVDAVDEQLVDEDLRGAAGQNAIGYSP